MEKEITLEESRIVVKAFSMPEDVFRILDWMSDKDNRSRSNMLVECIKEKYERMKKEAT